MNVKKTKLMYNMVMNLYGFFVGLAAVLILITSDWVFKNKIKTIDYLFIAITTLLFARAGYFLTNFQLFSADPLSFLRIYEGGVSIFGAFFGLGISSLFIVKKRDIMFLHFTDVILLNFPLAQSIGRLGNFFNQEVYGLPTNMPWGLYIEPTNRISGYSQYTHFHPIFAYEIILNILNWIFLLLLRKKYRLSVGLITCFYILNYGLIRLTVNRFRLEEILFLRVEISDFFSIILITLSCIILLSMVFSKKIQTNIAILVSKLFNPFLITMTPFFIIAFQGDLFRIEPLHITIIFLIGLLGPIVQIQLFKKLNLINDWDISDRSKRPLFTSIAGIIFFLIFLISLSSISLEIKVLTLSLTVVTYIFAIISTQWKISGHLTYLAFTISAIYLLIKDPLLILLFGPLLVLMSWSRVKLKHHNVAQTIAGTILGIVVIVGIWLLANSTLPF
jgi:phosphatidylglycerol---prolipoprotein diacylglyceryl transferase